MMSALDQATSPYQKLHKDNPVQWRLWGAEALAEAKAQNKPIFLSVGYTGCHWCHAMNQESFSDADTAEITHEALLRAWPRLCGWLEADRTGLALRQRLSEAAEAWDLADRDPALLLRGSRLTAAREWAAAPHRDGGLSGLEKEFLLAGEKLARRGVRRRRRLLATMTALVVLALLAAGTAFRQSQDAREAQRAAIARELTARYSAVSTDRPADAWVYAVEAYRLDPGLQDARSDLLSSQPGFRIPGAFTMDLSPDGHLQATGGTNLAAGDHTVRLWDVARHRLITTFAGLPTAADAVAFSPDGRLLAASGSSWWTVWDIRSRRVVRSMSDQRAATGPGGLSSTVFSPDGRSLVWGDQKGLHLWNVSSRDAPVTVPDSTSALPGTFSPDGRLLAFLTTDGRTLVLWDTRRRRVAAKLTGHTDWINDAVFSPDGTVIATAARDNTVRLWDVATHRATAVLRTRVRGATSWPYGVRFADGGHTLIVDALPKIQFWSVPGDRLITTVNGDAGLAQSRDGTTLAIADTSHITQSARDNNVGMVILYDARTLSVTGRISVSGLGSLVTLMALDSDYLAVGSDQFGTTIQDLDPDRVLPTVCRRIGRISTSRWHDLMPDLPYRATCP